MRRSAEARHGEGLNAAALHTDPVGGAARHQQSEGGIEPSGHADGYRRLVQMQQAFSQAGDLDVEDFLTALPQIFIAGGDERMRLDLAGKLSGGRTCGKREINAPQRSWR